MTQLHYNTLIVLAKRHPSNKVRKLSGIQLIETYLEQEKCGNRIWDYSLEGISQNEDYLPETRQAAGKHHINNLVAKGYYDSLHSIIECVPYHNNFPKEIQQLAKENLEAAAMSAIELIIKQPQERHSHSLEGIARDNKAPTSARILAGQQLIEKHILNGAYGSLLYMTKNEIMKDSNGKEQGTYLPKVVQKAKESIPQAAMNAYKQYTTEYAPDNNDNLYNLATSEICPLEIRTLAGIHLINNKYAYDYNGLDSLSKKEKFPKDICDLAASKVAQELERAGRIVLEEQKKNKRKTQ